MSRIANAAARLYGATAGLIPFDREPFSTLYSAAYFAYKRFEDPFAKLMAQRPELFEGGAIIDAGANIGYTSLLFAKRGRVHAFEPHVKRSRIQRTRRDLELRRSARGLAPVITRHDMTPAPGRNLRRRVSECESARSVR